STSLSTDVRLSRRQQGLPAEFGLLSDKASARTETSGTGIMSSPAAPSQIVFQVPRTPKAFHGDLYEDAEDWVEHFDRVAILNGWDDSLKLRNVYFSLEDAARVWFENRETGFTSWDEFKSQLLRTFANAQRKERAEQLLQARTQHPNEGVVAYVEEMIRLFRRANPIMTEEKKVRHLMKGVKQDLFGGLVRNPPSTVAEFVAEASTIEKTLQMRSRLYERQLPTASRDHLVTALGSTSDVLRELIRGVVREELQKLQTPVLQPTVAPVSAIIREEVQNALGITPVQEGASEPRTLSYAAAVRNSVPLVDFSRQAPSNPRPTRQFTRRPNEQRPPTRKTEVWRSSDHRPLCYHCGEAGHVYRQCPYRQMGLRGFSPDAPRPRYDQRPPEIEDYLNQPAGASADRRQSRSPSPRRYEYSLRRSSPDAPRARSPSPRRGN
ncbi:unnamed protein product, partial [Ixodes pacificus]